MSEQTLPIHWFPIAETDREKLDKLRDSIREALEWLDANAPGRARDVLIEALKPKIKQTAMGIRSTQGLILEALHLFDLNATWNARDVIVEALKSCNQENPKPVYWRDPNAGPIGGALQGIGPGFTP